MDQCLLGTKAVEERSYCGLDRVTVWLQKNLLSPSFAVVQHGFGLGGLPGEVEQHTKTENQLISSQ